MFRERLLSLSTQVELVYKLGLYLNELQGYLRRGWVVLTMEEIIELDYSLTGLRTFVDMIEYDIPGR